MRSFGRYLLAQSKRTVKLFPAILSFTLVLVLAVSILLFGLFGNHSSKEANMRVRIGIVGNLKNSYLDIGVAALKSMDTSRYYIEFIELDESEARKRLSTGDIKGYVNIPEGFVDSVADGGDMKMTYVMGNSPAVLGTLVMQEIVDIIGDILVDAQCATYGYTDLLYKADLTRNVRHKLMTTLTIEYVDTVLSREQWYDIHELGFSSGLSFEGYYTCSFLVLMFLLWGTVCINLLVKRTLSLQRVLYSRRSGAVAQTLAEYIPFFGVLAVELTLLLVGAGIAFRGHRLPDFLPEIGGIFGFLKIAVLLLPAVLLISALQYMLYSLTKNVISAVLLQILSMIALSYMAGLFYPLYSLPQALQTIAPYLPTGAAFNYISGVLTGSASISSAGGTLLYAVVFLALAAFIRSVRLRGSRV
ncbi:MAG: ABC transporter permease [Clostridia bacterium]|nr:ABC transporter permease [Clostridia bacterium]